MTVLKRGSRFQNQKLRCNIPGSSDFNYSVVRSGVGIGEIKKVAEERRLSCYGSNTEFGLLLYRGGKAMAGRHLLCMREGY